MISDILLPYLGLTEALVQKTPTFRIQLPNNVAVVKKHYDSDLDHRHPKGEINFVYALTDMYDSKIFEIIRDFYLLTNGVTVVSEVGSDTKSNNKSFK